MEIFKIFFTLFIFLWILRSIISFIKNIPLYKIDKMIRKLHPEGVYEILVIEDNSINAAASLEGNARFIIVNKGCLKQLTKNELYFILAHELSHHILNHYILRIHAQNIKEYIL